MNNVVTYSFARNNLASVLDEAESKIEPIVIRRRNHPDMVIVSAAEYEGLEETAYLLRSPKNAQRIFAAIARAQSGENPPLDLEGLKRDLGL